MYYESRRHELLFVSDANEAAARIKKGKALSHQVLHWVIGESKLYCVPDGHIDDPFLEVAILRQESDGLFVQVNSITAGWIDCEEMLAYAFDRSITEQSFKITRLIIGEPQGHEIGWLSCSCCGESFIGNLKEQLQYDKDEGFGCCKSCK